MADDFRGCSPLAPGPVDWGLRLKAEHMVWSKAAHEAPRKQKERSSDEGTRDKIYLSL